MFLVYVVEYSKVAKAGSFPKKVTRKDCNSVRCKMVEYMASSWASIILLTRRNMVAGWIQRIPPWLS